jgi:hypothetical protein
MNVFLFFKVYGAKEQLIQFLSGKGGSGKSFVLNAFKYFCKIFSMQCGLQFDNTTFRTTSMTGCSAANMDNGYTTHQQLQLNAKRTLKYDENWFGSRVLIIDEISFLDIKTLQKIDSNLRIFRNRRGDIFGGINIIFSGDLWQLPPVKQMNNSLYSALSAQWSSINSVVFLENNHRFRDDPTWGEILERIRTCSCTNDDVSIINERLLSQTLKLENNICYCYACPENKQRNEISDRVFQNFIAATHSKSEDIPPPRNTVIILSDMYDYSGIRHSNEYHNFIYQNCGDAKLRNGTKLIDPRLCLYHSCPVMLSTNDHLIQAGYANGTLCSFQGLSLKTNTTMKIKKFNGYFVNTVHVSDINYVLLKKWEDSPTYNEDHSQSAGLKVYAKKETVCVNINHNGVRVPGMKLKIHQFPILRADAITGHKLQGLSKDNLVVVDFDYHTPQWIYVALSRVRTRQGLFLMKKLELAKLKQPDRRLVAEERRLRSLE